LIRALLKIALKIAQRVAHVRIKLFSAAWQGDFIFLVAP